MPPKGKQGTKGQKQILKENVDTLAFYRNMILGTGAFYGIISYIFFTELHTLDKVLLFISSIVYFASYSFMSSMASPKYGENGAMLDEGCDLNIEGGLAEHIKDLVILTTGCVMMSSISSYFWLLGLLGPARAFQMVWTNILAPYFFQEAPPEPEVSDKKKKKMERKYMKAR